MTGLEKVVAFEKKYAIIILENCVFFFRNNRMSVELRILT